MKAVRLCICLAALILLGCYGVVADDVAITQQLLAQPPQKLVQYAEHLSQRGVTPEPMQVDFLRADLDGSGQFRYIVAFYYLSDSKPAYCCFYIRVFKQSSSGLTFVGETEDHLEHGPYGGGISLIDIDGDGIPELELDGTDSTGQTEIAEYLRWTGNSLHSLDSAVPYDNTSLEDVDGDGVDELIAPADDNNWNVYKFNGTDFAFWQSFNSDPEGLVGSDGQIHKVRAFLSDFRPATFALASIQSSSPKEQGTVKLVLGDLQDLNGNSIDVGQVDTNTIFLGTNLRPTSVAIRSATQQDVNADRAPDKPSLTYVLELEFARADILKWLPKLKLTAPLAAGDQLELKARAKLKDGTRVSAVHSVMIQGSQQ